MRCDHLGEFAVPGLIHMDAVGHLGRFDMLGRIQK